MIDVLGNPVNGKLAAHSESITTSGVSQRDERLSLDNY